MTLVKAIHLLEDCFDGSLIKQFELNQPLNESMMQLMAAQSRLDYHKHFPRPYFRIEKPHHWVIQGVLGEQSFRVTFSHKARERGPSLLQQQLEG